MIGNAIVPATKAKTPFSALYHDITFKFCIWVRNPSTLNV